MTEQHSYFEEEELIKEGQMSEKKGLFDDFMVAANEALISAEQFAGSMIPLLRATTKLGGISIAIRILEAAGKVDGKKDLEEFQRFMCRWGGMISSEQESYERIRALLESLPNKEEK